MELVPLRVTNKFTQNGGVNVTIIFHSADKQSMALFSVSPEEAKKIEVGKFYNFSLQDQKGSKT